MGRGVEVGAMKARRTCRVRVVRRSQYEEVGEMPVRWLREAPRMEGVWGIRVLRRAAAMVGGYVVAGLLKEGPDSVKEVVRSKLKEISFESRSGREEEEQRRKIEAEVGGWDDVHGL